MNHSLQVSDFLDYSIQNKMGDIDKKIEKKIKRSSSKNFFITTFFLTALSLLAVFLLSGRYEKVEAYDLYLLGEILAIFTIAFIFIAPVTSTFFFGNMRTDDTFTYKNNDSYFYYNSPFRPLNYLNTEFRVLFENKETLSPEVLRIVNNAEARGAFYNYEIVLLQHIKTIEDKLKKEKELVI